MKKILFILVPTLLLSFIQKHANAQIPNWTWARGASSYQSGSGKSVATDLSGNVYVTGVFTGSSISFGTTTLTNVGNESFYLVKYDKNGNVLWAKGASGMLAQNGSGIATDTNGNVYVIGHFTSPSIAFGSNTLTNAAANSYDIFVVKYDSSGNVLWAKSYGGSNDDFARAVATDGGGSIYIAGSFTSSSLAFSTIMLTNVSAGTDDFYLTKLDNNGNVIWAKRAGGSGFDESGDGISVDKNGNIYVVGDFTSSSIAFGTNTLINAGAYDGFLVKYDNGGNVLWSKNIGGASFDYISDAVTDGNGNVYVAGGFSGLSLNLGSITLVNVGDLDAFVAKFDQSGNVLWAKAGGGAGFEENNSITIDSQGDVYITGSFDSPLTSFGSSMLSNAGQGDIFLVKYSNNGDVRWAIGVGGSTDESSNKIAIDKDSKIYVTGYFRSNSVSFGSSVLTNANPGFNNIYLAKLDNSPTKISKISNSNNLTISPNPIVSKAVLYSDILLKNATLTLVNVYGQVVKEVKNLSGNTTVLQRDDLPGGMYIIRLMDNGELVATGKITIAD